MDAVGVAFELEQPATAASANATTKTTVARAERLREEWGAFKTYDCTRPGSLIEVGVVSIHNLRD